MHCHLRQPEPRPLTRWFWPWPWPLTFDLWSWTFAAYSLWRDETLCQIWTQSELLRFQCLTLWYLTCFKCCARLEGVWTQLYQIWPGYTAMVAALHFFVSEFGYLAAFSTAGGSKLSNVLNDAKFRTFWPLWKLGRDGRDPYTNCWSFTYDRTSEIHLMAVLCVAAEDGNKIRKFMGKT